MVSGSKRCPKKALATDRRQRRHELSREEIPAGKIPRISPSWAKNGKIRQSWGMGGEDLRQSRAYFPRIAMCIKREKTDCKWIDEPIEKEMRIEFVPASVFQSQRVLLMLHRSSLCCKWDQQPQRILQDFEQKRRDFKSTQRAGKLNLYIMPKSL